MMTKKRFIFSGNSLFQIISLYFLSHNRSHNATLLAIYISLMMSVADDKIDVSRETIYVSTFRAKVCYLLLADVSIMRYKLTCL